MTDQLEWIPDWRTSDRIRQLPAIMDELHDLDGTRNPADGPAIHHPPTFGSKAPCDETVTFLLDGREDSHWGGLARLQDVSRLVWDALGPDGQQQHPQPTESSWTVECAWLAPAWLAVVNTMPEVKFQAAQQQINDLYSSAAHAIGLQPKPIWPCLTDGCHGTMHITDGGYLECDNGHQHDGINKWRDHAPMPIDLAAEQLRIPKGTIASWQSRGQIPRIPGKPGWVKPWSVILKRFPEIVLAPLDGSA